MNSSAAEFESGKKRTEANESPRGLDTNRPLITKKNSVVKAGLMNSVKRVKKNKAAKKEKTKLSCLQYMR